VGRVAELGSLGRSTMTTEFPKERMGRLPRWGTPLFVGAALATIALCGLVSAWFMALPFIVAIFLGWYYHTRIRCPRCRRRLRSRSVPLDVQITRQQIYYDCPDCRVTWDPDVITYHD
jgi:hypothetical protein